MKIKFIIIPTEKKKHCYYKQTYNNYVSYGSTTQSRDTPCSPYAHIILSSSNPHQSCKK